MKFSWPRQINRRDIFYFHPRNGILLLNTVFSIEHAERERIRLAKMGYASWHRPWSDNTYQERLDREKNQNG